MWASAHFTSSLYHWWYMSCRSFVSSFKLPSPQGHGSAIVFAATERVLGKRQMEGSSVVLYRLVQWLHMQQHYPLSLHVLTKATRNISPNITGSFSGLGCFWLRGKRLRVWTPVSAVFLKVSLSWRSNPYLLRTDKSLNQWESLWRRASAEWLNAGAL